MPIDLTAFDPNPISAAVHGLNIGAKCGGGGQKAVWRAHYQGQDYVLKILVADPDSTERAKRELEVYRRCRCVVLPSLGPLPLSTLAVGTDTIMFYLEEFVDGLTVDRIPKPMPPRDVLSMAKCITDAIEKLWQQNFVHRDIKPANVIRRVNSELYILLDAGLALDALGPSLTNTGGIVGTLGFLSPDQLQLSKRDLDFRSDLFALGICMYMCLTGEHPFWNNDLPRGDINHNTLKLDCPHPRRWLAALPPEICDFVLRLLEKQRHLRYSKFDHLRNVLNRIVI